MNTEGTELRLQVERTVKSSPERVFKAWTEPDEMRHWFAPDPDMEVEAQVDLRKGGNYRVAMGPYVVQGEYLEVVPARRLVFSWQWLGESPSNDMLVTVEFTPNGDGTRIVITHEKLANEEARASHEQGWTAILERLDGYLGS